MTKTARAAAIAAGRDTYAHEVIETWVACCRCAQPIRRNITLDRPGLWRVCGCPGVLWQCTRDGWKKTP